MFALRAWTTLLICAGIIIGAAVITQKFAPSCEPGERGFALGHVVLLAGCLPALR